MIIDVNMNQKKEKKKGNSNFLDTKTEKTPFQCNESRKKYETIILREKTETADTGVMSAEVLDTDVLLHHHVCETRKC